MLVRASHAGRADTCGWAVSPEARRTAGNQCVEVAQLADGRIAVRNSKDPEAGVVLFTRAEMGAWLKGVKAGEFDDLT